MPSRTDVAFFGAGPAPLPTEVLEEASRVLLNYNDSGLGLTEISHRSPEAAQVLENAKKSLRTLLEVPEEFEIAFLHGGGTGEFAAVVYNMVAVWVGTALAKITKEQGKSEEEAVTVLREELRGGQRMKLDYIVTGSWSLKASQEAARLVGKDHVNVAIDARKSNDGKFGKIPDAETWQMSDPSNCALVYFCDNETVDGVEFQNHPDKLRRREGCPVVADMSSNFLSRRIDWSRYDAVFGGAQKNVGTTGITIVIMRKSLLPPAAQIASADTLRALNLSVGPGILDWPGVVKGNSLMNTLPIFDVWIAGRVMERLLKNHGKAEAAILGQQSESDKKAKMLYETLDQHPSVYHLVTDKDVRSRMNVCFRIAGGDADAEKSFLDGAKARHLLGLKGHRSVGGIRISNYNAVSIEQATKLQQYLKEFAEGQKK